MKKFLIGCGVFTAVAGLFLLIVGGAFYSWYKSTYNRDAEMRSFCSGQEKKNQAIYDNVWKTINQSAEISKTTSEEQQKFWEKVMTANSQTARATLMTSFVNKINPKFDLSLFKKLMNTVESSRKEFTNNQVMLIDKKREHDQFRTSMPVDSMLGRAIFGTFPEIKINVVTSGKTEEVFETGKEDDVSLFKKEEPKKEEPKESKKK